MSKIKKLGIIIFITVIAILGINAKSNAYYVGETIKINYSKYLKDNNMFCMEHNQALLRYEKAYKIISNVKIEGNKSTDHKGKTIDSWYNTKMASILNNDNGANKETGPVQNAIWNFGYTWMKNVGQYHNGLYLGFANNSGGTSSSIDESSSNDANNVNMQLKDNTNKAKIKVASYDKNGEKYLRIGPFNWTFSGKLAEIKVYNQNEKEISGILYSSFKGTTENWFGLAGIKSETDFYISIPANSGTAEITKIYAKTENEIKAVNIWFLEAVEGTYQNVLIREPYKATKNLETTFDYNIQMYVKISGYVWVDKPDTTKQAITNDLYKEGNNETDDILLDGITVRLKDRRTGEIIKETVTSELGRYKDSNNNGHGEYLFEELLIKDLENYYVEFEYDGLTYTNVVPHIDKNNGSKAAESATTRENFNKKFSIVEGKTLDTGFTRDENGNVAHDLFYNIDKNAHTATFINNGKYLITSNTDETKYNIASHYTGEEEIKYINLGLSEREKPDIALVKDIENVRVTINGYEHTYLYAQRNINAGEYESGFNVGVKFGNEYGKLRYSRPVYKADYEYINELEKDKELKVYVTYKIALKNQSTNLKTRINSIIDYYDNNYSIVSAGTSVDEKGNTIGNISIGATEKYNDKYTKTIITTNTEINPQNVQAIYVQFALNREAVLNILNDGENLDNVAEVNNYTVFDKNGKLYAGIDTDSNPGNVVPGDTTTYEDDTDKAPGLKLEVAEAREMSGKVFLDATSEKLMTGKIRQGSGIYEEGEKGIKGVEVTLTENTGSGKVYTATTDENGEFHISGFIPGDYTLTYTWGDEKYTVTNYKGTIYNEPERQQDPQWYKKVDPRYSDAIDNYKTRLDIDNETKVINSNTQTTIRKMNSTTPKMSIGVEYETTYTASKGDKYTYQIKNIDFGIVERARQDIQLTKRVKEMKVTLANGQVITNIKIDENGNVTGEKKYLTYMAPSENAIPKNGYIKLELDNELIQGATVEVTYGIQARNISELDYLSENFYKYGTVEGNVVKLEVKGLVDYLDAKWSFDGTNKAEWKVKTLDEIKNIVAEEVYNSEEIKNRTILYTESLQGKKLEPNQSATVELYATKVLANNEEINLNNEAEIAELSKNGGSNPSSTTGNYIPGTAETSTENDDDIAEKIIVTPNTGANLEFVTPVIIAIIVCAILGLGVVIIKKRVLNK